MAAPGDRIAKEVCRFYMSGWCAKGVGCAFAHPQGVPQTPPEGTVTVTVKQGVDCPFGPPGDYNMAVADCLPTQGSRRGGALLCRDWKSGCAHGGTCRFVHLGAVRHKVTRAEQQVGQEFLPNVHLGAHAAVQGGYPAVGSIVTTTGSQRGVAHATSPQTSPRSLPQQQQQQPQPQPTPSAPPSAAAGGAPAQVPAAGPQQHQQQQQPQPLGNVMFIPQNLERYLQEEGMRHIDELVEASECPQLAGGAHDSPAGAAGPAGTES
eukprot:TRINITY_DN13802_c0_g1_i4.p1 TRINITY_DN13802_c0_g1~~TRINITY_DN13802_c0_g1_i4.p1  ORF type:complete len:264 (+),score=56.48 TRINITY_DN13802_c0_g1_i4:68-859(+)